MSIENAFALREALQFVMTDQDTLDMIAEFTIYCMSKGLDIDEEFAENLFDLSWKMAANGASATAEHFLGAEGMDSLNDAIDELLAIEDSVEELLDNEDDGE